MTGNELTERVVAVLPTMTERVDLAVHGLTEADLNQPPTPGEWSILEIVEHMRLSHGSYLELVPPALEKIGPGNPDVRLTWVGRFLVRVAGPDGDAPVPKPFRPLGNRYSLGLLDEFRSQTLSLASIFQAAHGKDINRKSLRNPVVPILRMNVADVISVAEGHFERHVRQIENRAAALRAT